MSMIYDKTKPDEAKKLQLRFERRASKGMWDWRSVGAVVGLSGGVVSALIGCMLTASSWFMGETGAGAFVRTVGTILFTLTIPLLLFGAHCLDLTEKRKKRERVSRFKE